MSVIEGPPPAQIQSEKEVAEIPPATPPSTTLQPQPSANPETPSEQTAPNIPAPAFSQAEFPGEETTVQISAGKVTYVITNKGAMVRNILLSRHKTAQGEPIDLVEHENDGVLPLALESNNAQVTNILQNAYYKPSTTFIELSES